jgi:hypothetical protein
MSILLFAAFLCYAASALVISLILMLHCAPGYSQINTVVYVGICSVIGSLTVNDVHWHTPSIPTLFCVSQTASLPFLVMCIKAVGLYIAIKLTIEGINQAGYFQTCFL